MITDNFLIELAKAINGESNIYPLYAAFSSTVIIPAGTDTSLATEYDRSGTVNARSTNEINYIGIRSGAIASSTGDFINSLALLAVASGGNVLAEALVPSVLHSDTFDFETSWTVTIERK